MKEYKAHRKTKNVLTEHQEQALFMSWLELQHPDLHDKTFAIPNGAWLAGNAKQRAQMVAKYKREGLKKGVPDIQCIVRKNGYSGLVIEFKSDYNRPKSEQIEWLNRYKNEGWFVAVCWSFEDGQQAVKDYISGEVGNE